jgi:hypothetical protein
VGVEGSEKNGLVLGGTGNAPHNVLLLKELEFLVVGGGG